MATTKKAAVKSNNSSKPSAPNKAVKPNKAKDTKAAIVKKHETKAAAPQKKSATNSASKSSEKAAPAKKASVVGKNASQPAPAKKTVPVAAKAAAGSKAVVKAAPAKSASKPAPQKAAVKSATPSAKAPEKKAVAPVSKKAAPAPQPKAPAKAAAPAAPPVVKEPKAKKPAKVKAVKIVIPQAPKPQPKPAPTPAAYLHREEKKNNIVVAHRRLDNKAKDSDTTGITMMNFQPEFTRSILDGPEQQSTGPVYRYSDEELNEFRELIQGRLESARKELGYLQGLITRKDEAGTEDTENRYMNMEDGSGAMEREQLAQLASRQIQFINHLEKALIRIENKTYGICRVTGNLIDKARLRAVPHATLSIEAKKLMASK